MPSALSATYHLMDPPQKLDTFITTLAVCTTGASRLYAAKEDEMSAPIDPFAPR